MAAASAVYIVRVSQRCKVGIDAKSEAQPQVFSFCLTIITCISSLVSAFAGNRRDVCRTSPTAVDVLVSNRVSVVTACMYEYDNMINFLT